VNVGPVKGGARPGTARLLYGGGSVSPHTEVTHAHWQAHEARKGV